MNQNSEAKRIQGVIKSMKGGKPLHEMNANMLEAIIDILVVIADKECNCSLPKSQKKS